MILLAAMLLVPPASPAAFADLSKVYRATLDFFEGQPTRDWTCTPDDVWSLSSFRYEVKGRLAIELGPSNVVFGVHDKNVVWAAVFPDEPGTVKTSLSGDGEHVASLWMRFNPAHLGELFPAATVGKNGPAGMAVLGRRVCAWKIASGWQANNLPVIPRKNSIVLDADTVEGKRRYFVSEDGGVDVVEDFRENPLPPLEPMETEKALEAYDAVWKAFDEEYAKFGIRKDVDWKAVGDKHRAEAQEAKTTYAAAAAVGALVAELRDLHIGVKVGKEWVPGYRRERPQNGSWKGTQAEIGGWTETKHGVTFARTQDKIGYVNVYELSDAEAPRVFDDTLEKLADTTGLVLDLRFNGGGDELLGRQIAGRFLDKTRVYSVNQYRSGKGHEELGPKLQREVEPRGPWRYEAPVIVLLGQKTMSSAESLALMLAQCPQVTTMGDRTAGASANPRKLELAGGIEVNLPRWIDMDPDGKCFEDVGIAPEVKVPAGEGAFTDKKDAVLTAALEKIRKMPGGKRKPARSKK
jgi:hypothetical protein